MYNETRGLVNKAVSINMEEAVIKSSESGNRLVFANKRGENFDVCYESPAITLRRTVWAYDDFPFLVGFFQKIATNWKGWDKQIEWSSIEGEFRITATSDNLGHALLVIVISQYDDFEDWSANVKLRINTTQASDIVKGLKAL
jgi:hypothetical protein